MNWHRLNIHERNAAVDELITDDKLTPELMKEAIADGISLDGSNGDLKHIQFICIQSSSKQE